MLDQLAERFDFRLVRVVVRVDGFDVGDDLLGGRVLFVRLEHEIFLFLVAALRALLDRRIEDLLFDVRMHPQRSADLVSELLQLHLRAVRKIFDFFEELFDFLVVCLEEGDGVLLLHADSLPRTYGCVRGALACCRRRNRTVSNV